MRIPPPASFTSPFYPVRIYETDSEGLLTIVSLINYFQEAATIHAGILGFHPENLKKYGIGWVLSRLYIEIERYPLAGEKVRMVTWPLPPKHKTAFRDFLLEDSNGSIMAKGTSSWPVIDLTTRRMTDLPPSLGQLFPKEGSNALTFPSRTIPKLTQPQYMASITPHYFDLDFNQHVNNVHFVAWALEAMPDAFRHSHFLSVVDIVFRNEIRRGDTITTACAATAEPLIWQHGLTRIDNGIETARIRTSWGKKEVH